MKIIYSAKKMQEIMFVFAKTSKIIGLVPTMGALHMGHISLINKARKSCDIVVVSIFVNPKQFSKNEDYSKYPRVFCKDKNICSKNGVDYIFAPSIKDIYPNDFLTFVKVDRLSDILCGKYRPELFKGVTTIVTKLFNIMLPEKVFFGEKDYQQLKIIEKLVSDLNFRVKIVPCSIVREKSGLAMSSRNSCLTPAEYSKANIIFEALHSAKMLIKIKSIYHVKKIINIIKINLSKIPNSRIEYVKICNNNLEEYSSTIKHPARILVAVWVGKARLIDNLLVK